MYTVARSILKIAKWLWPVVLIPLISVAITTLIPLFVQAQPGSPLYIFLTPGPVRKNTIFISIIIFGILVLAPLIAWLILLTEGHTTSNKVLRKYLRAVEEAHLGLNPKGFAQQSALISVNVPLDAIFIHLNAVSDRPLYDLPFEQQKLLEELRSGSHHDLTPEQRETHIQRLRVLWYSELGRDWVEGRQKQNATIEEVLKPLKAERPVAVILGTPGSGKSTTMRWLALQMARASLSRGYHLPDGFVSSQIPVLIRISDYAKRLDAENIPLKQFFTEYIARTYSELSNLSNALLDELKKGHCLLLFDGLDEVASDSLRRSVAENISAFISDYDAETATTQHFNRFIVTSRIVGYEAGIFNKYAHYTLLDLEDKQIEQFLTNWCPAVEHYQAMAGQGMRPLTGQQEAQANKAGNEQRDRLLEALENNPSIKRLAVNPLMLTILALIQRSGRTLPQRRIELYQVATRTLLDNWNKEKGSRVFSVEEIPLAEQILGDLAYRLHSSDPVLTEQDVKKIASHAMDTFYQRQSGETKDATIQEFIETLRSSSGLFVESGQGLFSFMHRTFQEYYAALYLLRKPSEELKQFVIEKHNIAAWHEPLLLAIAYKSIQGSQEERRQASELIEAIANATDDYESVLRRSLLFAANCIVDCNAWSINTSMQQDIAYRLFELYGDSSGSGRYGSLQDEIKEVALFWLRGLPHGGTQHGTMPPLLTAWRGALINSDKPDTQRQEGAVYLLASIAPDLATCPTTILNALFPPLLQLASVQDWYRHDLSCSPEIHAQLFQTTARPCSQRVEEYALVVLRLLDAAGPAGWLHDDWRKWAEEQPELLQCLTRHSLEIDYLLTPAALPAGSDDPNWDKQFNLANEWKTTGQRNPPGLQAQLLEMSDTAGYPHAYLLKQMLDSELASPTTPWRAVWETCLQKEMSYGLSATYQTCLNLRILLCRGNEQQRREIANELMTDISKRGKQHTQALTTISNLYMLYVLYMRDELNLQYLKDMRYMDNLLYFLYMLIKLNMRDLPDMQYGQNKEYFEYVLDIRYGLEREYMTYMYDMLEVRYLRHELNKDQIIGVLNNALKQQAGASPSTALFALFSVLRAYDSTPPAIAQQVQNSIQVYQQQRQLPSEEERQLTSLILRQIGISPTTSRSLTRPPVIHSLPDERVTHLVALKQQDQLRKGDVEEILAACMDTRKMSEEKWEELIQTGKFYVSTKKANWTGTVGQFAWRLLSRPFGIEAEALPTVVQALNDSDAVVCAGAARLLQNCKRIPQDMREDAAKRIIHILSDDELSRRLFDFPGWEMNSEYQRLDDLLFNTLWELAE